MRWLYLTLALSACGPTEPPAPTLDELVAQKCPRVHLDKLPGDWIAAGGDPKTRFRVIDNGGKYTVWYVGGLFTKLELEGVKREKDVQLTEIPRGARKSLVEEGQVARRRMYLEPAPRSCAVRLFEGLVDNKGKEQVMPKSKEFLMWPDAGDADMPEFTFRPPDASVFLGEAATSYTVARAQIEELGDAKPDHEMGDVPVAAWSDAAEDGAETCTFDMDVFFDDMPVQGGTALGAGEVTDGHRQWLHTFSAPYTGNHQFEIYRYRTCDGGARELVGVAAMEAVLF